VTDVPIGVAEDWVRSWTASASERAAAAQSLSDQVSRLSVSASDSDQAITVTVNGSGVMTDLQLTVEAGRLPMDQLARTILKTMHTAQASLAEEVASIAAETAGPDSETARAVISSFERRFPPQPDPNDRDEDTTWRSHDR
jgi:DNA-binding protein YbaB